MLNQDVNRDEIVNKIDEKNEFEDQKNEIVNEVDE